MIQRSIAAVTETSSPTESATHQPSESVMPDTFLGLTATAWIAWVTVALAIIAIVQVCVYGLQAKYMRDGLVLTRRAANAAKRSAAVAESALIHAERAYLDVVDFSITNLAVGQSPRVNFKLRHSGRTPAREVNVKGVSAYQPIRPETPPGEMTTTAGNMFVAATGTIGFPIDLIVIGSEELMEIIDQGGLWLFIEVRYHVIGIDKERTYNSQQRCSVYRRVVRSREQSAPDAGWMVHRDDGRYRASLTSAELLDDWLLFHGDQTVCGISRDR
jgi:hypothetical protein